MPSLWIECVKPRRVQAPALELEDKEMQTLVDATSLDFFEKELQRQKLDDPNVRVMLAEKWVKMSSQAQKLALSLDYDLDGTALCLLLEAAASQAPQAPVVAAVPTLLHSCVLDLQKSWEEAQTEAGSRVAVQLGTCKGLLEVHV
ncbi:unnamed protein product [Effrenium voratum]|nr:unnamed protein product [Effrenium voratum]